jgi:hypothetical protein
MAPDASRVPATCRRRLATGDWRPSTRGNMLTGDRSPVASQHPRGASFKQTKKKKNNKILIFLSKNMN